MRFIIMCLEYKPSTNITSPSIHPPLMFFLDSPTKVMCPRWLSRALWILQLKVCVPSGSPEHSTLLLYRLSCLSTSSPSVLPMPIIKVQVQMHFLGKPPTESHCDLNYFYLQTTDLLTPDFWNLVTRYFLISLYALKFLPNKNTLLLG